MTPQEQVAHIADVLVEIEVQLDQRWMKLSEILALEEGSILEMRDVPPAKTSIFMWARGSWHSGKS